MNVEGLHKHNPTRREKQLRRCIHFRGFLNKNGACSEGVDTETVTDENITGMDRFACFNPAIDCAKRRLPTPEELDAQDQEFVASLDRMRIIRTAILADLGDKKSGSGRIKCPCCEGGTVGYSRASLNGHVHARCSTPGCASWME